MSSPIPRRACRVIPYPRCAHSVIPRSDAESREYRPWSADLFIITFFSLPNRLRCGHPVIPHSDAGFRNTRLGQPNLFIISFFSLPNRLRCGHPVIPYFDAVSRNTGKFTRKILFPGPSIAVRGDTVLDAASRIYPWFIPKENSQQYRPGQ